MTMPYFPNSLAAVTRNRMSNPQVETTVEPDEPPMVTQLTPPGRAAVASLAIEGAAALRVIDACFQPRGTDPFAATPEGVIRFGTWQHGSGEQEEVVVCRRSGNCIEVHCHGGDAAAAAIIATLHRHGAVVGDARGWLSRRGLEPLQISVRTRLAQARTQRTAGILLDQLQGAWSREIDRLADALHQPDDQEQVPDWIIERLDRLIQLGDLGRHLIAPWRVVIAGAPNVGKSSLVNAMLGFSRCIVFDQPGTTRDIVATHTALDGWPVELVDTAGLRHGGDAIEIEGVERALSHLPTADLVIHVVDATQTGSADFPDDVADHPNRLVVANKIDLLEGRGPLADVATSAVEPRGVAQLIAAIVSRLIPVSPEPGEAVPVEDWQRELLSSVRTSLTAGRLKQARQRLGEHDNSAAE